MLIVEHAARFDAWRVFPTILGNIACLLIIALAAALGVGAVLEGAPRLFLALQLCGAAYLGYVGLRKLRAALAQVAPNGKTMDAVVAHPSGTDLPASARFRQAFLISATNPKAVLFLGAVFPSFIEPYQSALEQFSMLFVTLTLVVSSVHLGFALMVRRVSRLLGDARFNRQLNLVSGIAFLSFALMIIGAGLVS